ncbi:hypothetical protein [Actinomadura atramentaria]|uniref:hypothetical protein n=1 Tax=Actinomadura atramentaria TaxID=1990 RepID=UPI00035FD57F|nr:hypothetical protein [Actinomadura atramentaria]
MSDPNDQTPPDAFDRSGDFGYVEVGARQLYPDPQPQPQPQPPTGRHSTSRERTIMVVAVATALVVVGAVVVALAMARSSQKSGGRLDAVGSEGYEPGARREIRERGPRVRVGRELEQYLLNGVDLPGGLAIKPGSLKSSGTLPASMPTPSAGKLGCGEPLESDSAHDEIPTASVDFASPGRNLKVSETIMVGPPGALARMLPVLRDYYVRCPESTSELDGENIGEKMHISAAVEDGGLGPNGFVVRMRISQSGWFGSVSTADARQAFVRVGDALVEVMVSAPGRELQPDDGFDDIVAKAVEKVRRAA